MSTRMEESMNARKALAGVLIAVVGLGLLASNVWAADCPPGTFLKHIGSVATVSGVVSTTGHKVRASRIACGSACVGGVHNADTGVASSNATINDEPGAPANTSIWTEYDPPLDFNEGIYFQDDGNVNALLLFECK